MTPEEIRSAQGNRIPLLSKKGKTKKNSSEGNTAQNIPVDRLEILCTSFVSRYSHIIARIEVSGRDARIAATGTNLFANSETPAMTKADTMILTTNSII
jgi:hypothetical protein